MNGQMLQDPRLEKLFIPASMDEDDFLDAKKKVSDIYTTLQKVMCVAIPDEAMQEAIMHPLSAKLATSSLDEMRQHYLCLYNGDGAKTSFATQILIGKATDIGRF